VMKPPFNPMEENLKIGNNKAKEKAVELVSKMAMHQVWHSSDNNVKGMQGRAKECALIAQKNILDKLSELGIEDKFEVEVYNQINAL